MDSNASDLPPRKPSTVSFDSVDSKPERNTSVSLSLAKVSKEKAKPGGHPEPGPDPAPPVVRDPSVSSRTSTKGKAIAKAMSSTLARHRSTSSQRSLHQSRNTSISSRAQISPEELESPSIIALSNLRCPSPPPILQHRVTSPVPTTPTEPAQPADNTDNNDTSGVTGITLRKRVAAHAVTAAMAAQTAREMKEGSTDISQSASPVNSGSGQFGNILDLPEPSHHKAPSMHAHFYVEDTVTHGGRRSRGSSIGSQDTSLSTPLEAILGSANSTGAATFNPPTTPSGPSPVNGLSNPEMVSVRLPHDDNKMHVLFGACGSISIKKTKLIIHKLEEVYKDKVSIQLILTKAAEHFVSRMDFPQDVVIWKDSDEWSTWHNRGDPVVHIELRRWADIFIVAPMTANTLSKIALGLCDNLLTNVIRAWNSQYPVLLAPAMVSFAYTSPITRRHAKVIKEEMKWVEILQPTEKVVSSYGEIGMGGMMDWNEIVDRIVTKLGGYPEEEDEDDGEDDNGDDEDDDDDDSQAVTSESEEDDDDDDDSDDDDGNGSHKITVAEEEDES